MNRRWTKLSHRTRVTLVSAISASVVLGVVLFFTGYLLTRASEDSAYKALNDTANRIRHGPPHDEAHRFQGPPPEMRPNHDFNTRNFPVDVAVYKKGIRQDQNLHRTTVFASRLDLVDLPQDYLYIKVPGEEPDTIVYVAIDWRQRFLELAQIHLGLFILWPLLTAVLALTTYLATGASFAPLNKILRQAQTLTIDDRLETLDQAEFGELARSINAYLDRLQETTKQQEEFAVDAAHELATPLTALKGELELAIRHKATVPDFIVASNQAIAQVNRLQKLISGLLMAARPRDAVAGSSDALMVVEEAQARWVDKFEDKGVHLDLEGSDFITCMPEEEVDSVVENLLANAFKFSPPDTKVSVTLSEAGHLVVQDEGPGIPEEKREKVFARFERTMGQGGGNGIGLYLVRKLLEQRGGRVFIGDSSIGARVEVQFPG